MVARRPPFAVSVELPVEVPVEVPVELSFTMPRPRWSAPFVSPRTLWHPSILARTVGRRPDHLGRLPGGTYGGISAGGTLAK
ncbi:hypothetical protein GCM10010413_17490 [Promicromonospora sukumoe]